jgi:hypothetical protein
MGSICKARFNAEVLNECYEGNLKKIRLLPGVKELFNLILANERPLSNQQHSIERKLIITQISEQELLIAQARKLLLKNEIEADDFIKIKRDYKDAIAELNIELENTNGKLQELMVLRRFSTPDL